jgi:uncharacterized RDD family membrane protein YckC
MSEDEGSANTAYQIRAGFWGRSVALGIDLLVISVLIAVIGLASTGLTGGKVRVANTVVDFFDCTGSEPPPRDLPVLEGFEGADARRCTRSVLGIAHDWRLVVREKMTAGEDERNRRQVSIPLDAKGHPVRAFYLDDLIPLVLAAYLLLLEWRFGTTLGKRMVGIRVRSLGGGPMDFVQAGKRVLMRLIVLLPASTTQILPGSSTESHGITFGLRLTLLHSIPDLGTWSDVLNVLALAYLVSFIVTTSRRTLPLHDRWARTEAVWSA